MEVSVGTDPKISRCNLASSNGLLSIRGFPEDVILSYPDYKKAFDLKTDTSAFGIGAVLSQEGRPITMITRTITDRELFLLTLISAHFTDYSQAKYIPIIDGRILVWEEFSFVRHTANLSEYRRMVEETGDMIHMFPQSHMQKLLSVDVVHLRNLLESLSIHHRVAGSLDFLGAALKSAFIKIAVFPMSHHDTMLRLEDKVIGDCDGEIHTVKNCSMSPGATFCQLALRRSCAQELHAGGIAHCYIQHSDLHPITYVDEGIIIINDHPALRHEQPPAHKHRHNKNNKMNMFTSSTATISTASNSSTVFTSSTASNSSTGTKTNSTASTTITNSTEGVSQQDLNNLMRDIEQDPLMLALNECRVKDRFNAIEDSLIFFFNTKCYTLIKRDDDNIDFNLKNVE
ncbi:hypothetical protein KR200_006955 [Drosophila serrata]|nr:hypothetical protein KR200_006955 [Drosophila serrata]